MTSIIRLSLVFMQEMPSPFCLEVLGGVWFKLLACNPTVRE